jgi:hypothetical protein
MHEPFPSHLPNKLALTDQKVQWVEAALRAGHVCTDSGLWLGGVDHPDEMIRALRKKGVPIKTTHKHIQDAGGEWHKDLAWRLAEHA